MVFSQKMMIKENIQLIDSRKNLLITVNNLSLEQRRIIDVIFYIATQNIEENLTLQKYVSIKTKDLYEVDLSFFKWLLHFSNSSNSHLKDIMSSVQSARITAEEVSSHNNSSYDKLIKWQSHNFFGSSFIDAQKKKVGFSINPILKGYIHKMKKTHYALPNWSSKILYDWLMLFPHFDTPFIFTFDELLKELGQENKKTYKKFDIFNKVFLKPAVEGINNTKKLNVKVIAHPHSSISNRITHIELIVKKTDFEKDEYDEIHQCINKYQPLLDAIGLLDNNFE